MKKYSTLLLSSAVLLASLAQNSLVSAHTTTSTVTSTSEATTVQVSTEVSHEVSQPATTETTAVSAITELAPQAPQTISMVHSPMTTQQNGQTLSIFYNRSEEQKGATIHYAVWSVENGQDDLKWYVAGEEQTDIPLSAHKGEGQYMIHSYITVQDRMIFLEENRPTITKPNPSITTAIAEPGIVDVHIQHLPANLAEVRVPIWSNQNGQDELQWYTAHYNEDGTYSVRVFLKNHKFDTGTYSIHLYAKETPTSKLNYITESNMTVEKAHIPAQQAPSIFLKDVNKAAGSYTVVVKEQANTKKIKKVDIATWSTANQSNLKWRHASLQNEDYITSVNFQEHQGLTGHYQNHVYVTYEDGSRVGYIAETVDLSTSRLPVQFSNQLSHTGNMSITLKNIYSDQTVNYAVWSDANGQDDLKWYAATKASDKTFTGNIPLSNHVGTGKYHVHVYQGNKGLGAFTMHISQDQRVREPNTYPVGQCTWGVKEIAPWVGNWWGDAKMWPATARRLNLKTGNTPKVGAVISWSNGRYGHVAVVTEVASPTRIRVKESNYAGRSYVGDFRGWFNPFNDGPHTYIYPN
ncbi:GBS Bsp-like repeat-containing protein [Streptococcus ovis]|uniref:GBS Bsp-like repeat-containing protein n=1 Tax=Streptococcus ovis TaxID=82806 RepID=UPI00036F13F9|nr:GBS Bsp-like repeat-containing protein [Streptococcus ovis]